MVATDMQEKKKSCELNLKTTLAGKINKNKRKSATNRIKSHICMAVKKHKKDHKQ